MVSIPKEYRSSVYGAIGSLYPAWPGRFILLAQGRSGGTTLLKLLQEHPRVRITDEPLSRPVARPLALLEGLAIRCRFRRMAWGGKVKHWHLTDRQELPSAIEFLQQATGRGWLIIYLKRENLVKQAIAGLARRSDRRMGYHHDSEVRIHIPVDALEQEIRNREHHAAEEARIIDEIPVLRLYYERDLLDPDRRQLACDRVFANLGLPSHPVTDGELRTEPDDLRAFVQNADAIEEYLERAGLRYSDSSLLSRVA